MCSKLGRSIIFLSCVGLLVFVLTILFGFSYIPVPVPRVTIAQGEIKGIVVDRSDFPNPVEAYLGIPYAVPPIGQLRFARPQPVPASNETFDASRFGSRCPGTQLVPLPGDDNGSEDCLTANVFKPVGYANSNLPVAVYFHGGAFNRGSAIGHDTASMVAFADPFVAVSFNYRLGALGFLNSALAAKEGILNLGLHDQVLLLEWVQKNIAGFGGDPNQVTVFGLSAGAHSIGHHILNNKGLFHRAIMESGGPYSRALHHYNSTLNEQQSQLFMSKLGCHDIPCLRLVNETKLINASDAVFDRWDPSLRWAWQPVIDGDLIPERALDRPRPNIPILTGFTTNEGSLYVPRNLSASRQFDSFFSTLLPELHSNLSRVYPERDYPEWRSVGKEFRRLEAAYGQYAYSCTVRQTASLFKNVYLYHWAVNRTVIGGAGHGDQLPYETMDRNVRRFSSTQREISNSFHGYVTRFITTGDPNAEDWPEWRPVKEDNRTLIFGLDNDERAGGTNKGITAQFIEDDWALNECEFWDGFRAVLHED